MERKGWKRWTCGFDEEQQEKLDREE